MNTNFQHSVIPVKSSVRKQRDFFNTCCFGDGRVYYDFDVELFQQLVDDLQLEISALLEGQDSNL